MAEAFGSALILRTPHPVTLRPSTKAPCATITLGALQPSFASRISHDDEAACLQARTLVAGGAADAADSMDNKIDVHMNPEGASGSPLALTHQSSGVIVKTIKISKTRWN